MKNKFISLLIFIFVANNLSAENFNINAKNISIDKKNKISVFKNNVVIIDEKNNEIKSEFASYDKKSDFFILKKNVSIKDPQGNILQSEEATYNKKNGLYKIIGEANILTAEGYAVKTSDITLDTFKNILQSKKETRVEDLQGNLILLENFEYLSTENIFKSIGIIKVTDKQNNSYEFSQIYIDEKKREIIGTDSKVFFNSNDFKIKKDNKPRIFSNAISIKNSNTKFTKSVFTLCNYRKNDKCPPWELVATEMRHNKKKKTIYYDNALIKIYNIPIFYIPKLQHPDPTVLRRSGFLVPSFADGKNLGTNINVPYFWAINKDKDLTINSRLFATEHPLFLGEYRQAFKNSTLISDFGYSEGYKSNSKKNIRSGDRSHLFARLNTTFNTNNTNENNLELNLQQVSDKKYLKLYRIDSNLVNYETNTLENTIEFNHFNDENNLSLNLQTGIYRTLTDTYKDKYEYIIPDLSINKFILSENYGYGNLQSNLKVHNYDTNKFEKFFINDFQWSYEKSILSNLYDGKILTKIKNLNYEAKNISKYKNKPTNEIYGALGYLASIDLFKEKNKLSSQFLTPKILLKYAPNYMKKETSGFALKDKDLFSLDRLDVYDNFEGGTNLTVGLDYQNLNQNNQFDFSIGQIINEKKGNKNMPSSSSLDKRFSDIVGNIGLKNNQNYSVAYDFAVDRNYQDLNYSNLSANLFTEKIKFNFDYLEEDINSNKKEYFNSSFAIKSRDDGLFTLSTKRNLITNSSEFYKLSYEYINDCLRAGLVYRREFYEDSELEPENSLMFTITLSPFGSLSSPKLSK
jgi:LPS-assembly protein